jgi:UDP-N-acetylmuramoyl-tripeptide--D-alanyl-D-alanine ligase
MKEFLKKIVTSIITYEAKRALKKYKPKIVVVVGSVGKTTTKDSIYTVLKDSFYVRKSLKSFNSELGVPLTILGLQNAWTNPILWMKNIIEGAVVVLLKNKYPEWLVLEVGADHPGDIRKVADMLKVDVIVLTRLPDVPVHVEYFDSPQAVIDEKLSILDALKEEGAVVINADDEKLQKVRDTFGKQKIVSFGLGTNHTVGASHVGIMSKNKRPVGTRFHLRLNDKDIPLELTGVLGKQHIYPNLAAAAVGNVLGVEENHIVESFRTHSPAPGRMRVLPGVKDTTIIDDTYNSSPVAVEEALNVIEQVHCDGRKIVVLGDMMELGKFSIEEHKRVGKRVAEVADILLTVGFRARDIAEGALQYKMHGSKIFQYDDVERCGKELEHMLEAGDVVLLKASQSIRMEKAVKEIMKEPLRAKELIARQEVEWEVR